MEAVEQRMAMLPTSCRTQEWVRTPKAFNRSVQGCTATGYPGKSAEGLPNLKGLHPHVFPQNSTPAGLDNALVWSPRLAPAAQPWAEGWNAVGVPQDPAAGCIYATA